MIGIKKHHHPTIFSNIGIQRIKGGMKQRTNTNQKKADVNILTKEKEVVRGQKALLEIKQSFHNAKNVQFIWKIKKILFAYTYKHSLNIFKLKPYSKKKQVDQ